MKPASHDRRFNLDKFRVYVRLTVKSSACHSGITRAEWQFLQSRRTRKILVNTPGIPSQLTRVVTLCSLWWIHLCLNRKPQVLYGVQAEPRGIFTSMLNEQEAPKWFVRVALCRIKRDIHSYAQWAGSPQVTICSDKKSLYSEKWNDRGPELSGMPALLCSL